MKNQKYKLLSFLIVLFTSLTVAGIAAKHFWDVIIDNNLDVVGTIGGSGGGVSFDEFLNLEQEVTPPTPSTNEHRLYFKSDGNIYKLDDAGIEKKIGSGSGGGGSGINLLVEDNFNCEDGSPPISWTSTGGTFVAESGSPGFDLQSCSWDPSATSEFLRTASPTIPDGLFGRNCVAKIQYKFDGGVAGDIKWKVETSADVLIAGPQDLGATSDWVEAAIHFTCPSSGNMRIEFESTADAAIALIDNVELGTSDNVSVSQAQLVAHAYYPGTTNCSWNHNQSTPTDFPTDSDCPSISVISSTIAVDTADNDLPDIDFDHLPPGTYHVEASLIAVNDTGNAISLYRISDGTTDGETEAYHQTTANIGSEVKTTATFTYTSGGARNFKIQGGGQGTLQSIANSLTGSNEQILSFRVWKVPTSNAEAITLETVGEHWDVNIGGANPDLQIATFASYTEIDNSNLDMVINSGSKDAEIPCDTTNPSTGLTCSAGDESVGIVIDITTAGRYRACGYFSQSVGDNSGATTINIATTFQWVETPNNAQTISQEGGSRLQSVFDTGANAFTGASAKPFTLCGEFTFTSAGQKTLRIMREQTAAGSGTNLLVADRNVGKGQRDIHITVDKLNQQMPTPVFTELKSKVDYTPGAVTQVIARGQVGCSGSSSILKNPGGWILSVGNISAGACVITYDSSIFDGDPQCFPNAVSSPPLIVGYASSPTSGSMTVDCISDGGIDCGSYSPDFWCIGDKP